MADSRVALRKFVDHGGPLEAEPPADGTSAFRRQVSFRPQNGSFDLALVATQSDERPRAAVIRHQTVASDALLECRDHSGAVATFAAGTSLAVTVRVTFDMSADARRP